MPAMRCPRDSPTSVGPWPTRPRTFVARMTCLRRAPSAVPRSSSAAPNEYVSAVSKKLMPVSRHRLTWRSASCCAVCPMAWLLHRSFTTSVIIGARDEQQLRDNLAAVELKLTPAQLELIDAASALPPEYPGWMVTIQDRDRLQAIPPEQRFAKT